MSRSNGGEGREANPKVCASIIGAPRTVTHFFFRLGTGVRSWLSARASLFASRARVTSEDVRQALQGVQTRGEIRLERRILLKWSRWIPVYGQLKAEVPRGELLFKQHALLLRFHVTSQAPLLPRFRPLPTASSQLPVATSEPQREWGGGGLWASWRSAPACALSASTRSLPPAAVPPLYGAAALRRLRVMGQPRFRPLLLLRLRIHWKQRHCCFLNSFEALSRCC